MFARLVGPAGKGDYYLLVLLPATAMVLIQLGLPSALGFYSARSQTLGILKQAIALAILLSLIALVAVALLYPVLQQTVLKGLDPGLIVAALLAVPMLAMATFTTGILTALKAVRWYTIVQLTQAVASIVLVVIVIGVLGIGPGSDWHLSACGRDFDDRLRRGCTPRHCKRRADRVGLVRRTLSLRTPSIPRASPRF